MCNLFHCNGKIFYTIYEYMHVMSWWRLQENVGVITPSSKVIGYARLRCRFVFLQHYCHSHTAQNKNV